MLKKIKLLIVDDVEDTRHLLKQVLTLDHEHFHVVGEASDGLEALKKCGELKPDIVLMDINMPNMNGLEATEQIVEQYPNTDVIIMSVQSDTEYLKTAMSAGAKGYVLKPINHEEVGALIQSTFDKKKARTPLEESKEAKVISYYSFKGGVGKSVIALNSAVILAEKLKKKVLLIDMDLHFGDISLLIDKHQEKTILDLVDDGFDDYDQIKAYLYEDGMVDYLFAPLSPEGAEYISKDTISNIINLSKTHYDYIILDTGVNFDEHTLLALDLSDEIGFITSMEMTAVKNSKLGLGVMKSLNYDDDKVKIIVNMCNEKFGVSKSDVEKVFGKPAALFLPEDLKTVRTSVNKGEALALKHKNSKFYKHLYKYMKEM